MNLIKLIKEELNKINENNSIILYHGSKNEINLSNKNIWVTPDINYAKNWGNHIYEINFNLNNIFDTVKDLDNKKLSIKQLIKYLKLKNIDTEDLEWQARNYIDDTKKYMFWNFISNDNKPINYGWIAQDIFMKNYDAIKLYEYGFIRNKKTITYLINKPIKKIISIKEIINKIN